MTATISVIIPTFNRAALICSAIDSVLNQSRPADEVIVVDDGSTDDTLRELRRYGSRIKTLAQPNRGCSAARNAGLRAAGGDFLVFLDSDDLLTEGSLQQRAEILEQSPEVDVVYGDMILIDADGRLLGRHRDCMPGPRPSGDIFAELSLRCFVLMPAMVRRTALCDYLFDESLGHAEDYDLWRRVAAHSQFKYFEEPIAYYRIHDCNTVTTQSARMQQRELEVQGRFLAMSAFQRLSPAAQARTFRSHAAKHVALEQFHPARFALAKAVAARPWSVSSQAMLAASVVAPQLLRRAVLTRRSRAVTRLDEVAARTEPTTSRRSQSLGTAAG